VRWSTDLRRVWRGKDGWLVLARVIDCHTRQLLGWHLGLVFTSRHNTRLVRSYGLNQEFITPQLRAAERPGRTRDPDDQGAVRSRASST
jgi:transposase InsO family protein